MEILNNYPGLWLAGFLLLILIYTYFKNKGTNNRLVNENKKLLEINNTLNEEKADYTIEKNIDISYIKCINKVDQSVQVKEFLKNLFDNKFDSKQIDLCMQLVINTYDKENLQITDFTEEVNNLNAKSELTKLTDKSIMTIINFYSAKKVEKDEKNAKE